MRSLLAILLTVGVVAACTDDRTTDDGGSPSGGGAAAASFPPAPSVPSGPLGADVEDDLDAVFADPVEGFDRAVVERIGRSGDARIGWLLSDLLRFFPSGDDADALVEAFEQLTGATIEDPFPWRAVTDHLISWDLPSPPGYVGWKARLFTAVEPAWEPFFADTDSAIDWRLVTWGGVLIDDRPLDAVRLGCPDGCIPALDDPAVTDAGGGGWYADDALVFGIVVGDDARAYPKNVMEVHEMVNDTLGGRRIAVPYCTLCLSAQAYLTDDVPAGIDTPTGTFELRTTGLLSRSNKVMYEFHTTSVLDTFTGVALSGPLRDAGVELEQISVVTSTWGEWKRAHPDTTIVAQDSGIGASYEDDPLGGRDDDGPIFPIGSADPRLGVQDRVLGVETPDGRGIAFPIIALRAAPNEGEGVESGGVRVIRDAGGYRAETTTGDPLVSHEAFWFAWSQFFSDTVLWSG